MGKRQKIFTKVERAELSATRLDRQRKAKERPPAPDDPEAVDTSHHDAFAWQVYEMRGLFAFHPQDKRLNAAMRLMIRLAFWNVHHRRKP